MNHLLKPAWNACGVMHDYIVAEFAGDTPRGILIRVDGLPFETCFIEGSATIVSVTSSAAPTFRDKVHQLAGDGFLDVVLIRCCSQSSNFHPVSVETTLARDGLAATSLHDLALYRHDDGALWLVPVGFGGAIRIGSDGLELHLVPPYSTLIERAQGIDRAACELASLSRLRWMDR
jgi:hypothetical protein